MGLGASRSAGASPLACGSAERALAIGGGLAIATELMRSFDWMGSSVAQSRRAQVALLNGGNDPDHHGAGNDWRWGALKALDFGRYVYERPSQHPERLSLSGSEGDAP